MICDGSIIRGLLLYWLTGAIPTLRNLIQLAPISTLSTLTSALVEPLAKDKVAGF